MALACSGPPEGKQRWTLRLLAERMVELEVVSELSHETVRQRLKKQCAQAAPAADGCIRPSTRPRPRPAPGQALPDRVGDRATLERHVQAWQHRRNAAATRADWQFTTKDARIKLRKLYPTTEE